jgi:hypothetical protein
VWCGVVGAGSHPDEQSTSKARAKHEQSTWLLLLLLVGELGRGSLVGVVQRSSRSGLDGDQSFALGGGASE